MDPATIAVVAPAVISTISSILSGNKQGKYQEQALKDAKLNARRGALERAIGMGGVSRAPIQTAQPNLFPYQAVNSLAQLGSSIYGGMK